MKLLRKLLIRTIALVVLLYPPPGYAQWTESGLQDQPAAVGGVTHRHIEMEASGTGESATLDLAIFSGKSAALRVIDNGETRGSLADAMRSSNCIAGINGGYFDPEFRPIGLRIADRKTITPIGHGRLMSGIIVSDGSVEIVRVAEFRRATRPVAALECGPMLVDGAKPVRGLEASRSARRTFVASGNAGRVALGSTSSVTLADLSAILTNPLGDFKVQRALNLDGGSSSAFWFKRAEGNVFSIPEEKTVRDFLAVVAR
jgi:hypothetical protein